MDADWNLHWLIWAAISCCTTGSTRLCGILIPFTGTRPSAFTVNVILNSRVASIVAAARGLSEITGDFGSSRMRAVPSFIARAVFPSGEPAVFIVALTETPSPAVPGYLVEAIFLSALEVEELVLPV